MTAVPGPVAAITALTLSGFDTSCFLYLGFLPRTTKERRRVLAAVAGQSWPLVVLEAPHRLAATLTDLQAVLGDRPCVVARELTKLHEEVRREPLSAALAHFTVTAPRGEFTIVVAGAAPPEAATVAAAQADQEQQARTLLVALAAAGLRSREAVAQVTQELGLSRRRAYELWLEIVDQA